MQNLFIAVALTTLALPANAQTPMLSISPMQPTFICKDTVSVQKVYELEQRYGESAVAAVVEYKLPCLRVQGDVQTEVILPGMSFNSNFSGMPALIQIVKDKVLGDVWYHWQANVVQQIMPTPEQQIFPKPKGA